MATDKPGVMAFLNLEVYNCLVAFKEAQRLRSLSHTVELVLGEYFGIAITPITLSRTAVPIDQPILSPKTLVDRIDQLAASHASLHQVVLHLRAMTELLLEQRAITLPTLETQCKTTALQVFPNCSSPHSSQANLSPDNSGETLPFPTTGSEFAIPAALARKGLTGLQLAKRLRVHSSVISRKKQKSYFRAWTSQLDPIGLEWEYVLVTRRFHPVNY
jgi:hypothetical protein